MKNSFSNELKKDFEQSKKIKENDYNNIKEENYVKKDKDIISKIQSNQNEIKEQNIFQTRLIQSTKIKHKININININMNSKNDSKDKPLIMNTETPNNNPGNLVKEKREKIINLEIITDKIQLDNNIKINSVKKDLIYLGSNKNVINTKSTLNNNTINGKEKKQTKKNSIKSFNKNQKENNNSNLFINVILGKESLYTIRNNKKYYLDVNKNNNKKKTIVENEGKRSKENGVSSVKFLDKYNEIKPNKAKNTINLDKNNIYINKSQPNNTMKDLIKYFKKNDEPSNNKNNKINVKVAGKNDKKYLNKNGKELYNKILERKVKKKILKRNNTKPLQKKINEKYLNIDKSPYNTINVKESFNNKQKNINKVSSQNINKLLINNYYYKIKTYVQLNKMSVNREIKKKKKENDNFLNIVLSSIPKTIINSPNYKKLSLSSSPSNDSKDKKKGSSNNNIRYKKIDI